MFQQTCGTINISLKTEVRKETHVKFYKVMAVSAFLYGSETWILTVVDKKMIQAAKMRFLRSVKGCTLLDKIPNEKNKRRVRNNFSGEINHKLQK